MSPPPPRPWAGSPYRRRRILWSILLLSAASLYLLYAHTSITSSASPVLSFLLSFLPSSSSSSPSRGSSRVEAVANALNAGKPQREMDAFLHFVVAYPERTLGYTAEVQGRVVDVSFEDGDVDARVYAPDGDYDWEGHAKVLREEAPIIVFSKTYCQYSQRAKALLQTYEIEPVPRIIELDKRPDGAILQSILKRLTGRGTVPNILLLGDSIGGSDDIHAMHDEHRLATLFREAGLQVNGDV